MVYDAALHHQGWLIHLEHACYFATGRARLVAARPGRADGGSPSGLRAGYAFAAFVFAAPLGLLLALLPDPIYAYYVAARPRVLGPDAARRTSSSPA